MELQIIRVCESVCVCLVLSHPLCIVSLFRLCHITRLYVGFFILLPVLVLPCPLCALCVCARVRHVFCDVAYLVLNVICPFFPALSSSRDFQPWFVTRVPPGLKVKGSN